MGRIQNAYHFSFQKETHAALDPRRSCLRQVPLMSSVLERPSLPYPWSALETCARNLMPGHGPEVKWVHSSWAWGGQLWAGLSREFKVSALTSPQVKDPPQVGTGFPEASKTNSDKQMRCRKLAGSQREAGCQAWGGEGPEKTEGFHHTGLSGQLRAEPLPLPLRSSPLGRIRCRSGNPACPGETRLGPGAGQAGRSAVRLANSVQEGNLASRHLLTWRQGPGWWQWWGGVAQGCSRCQATDNAKPQRRPCFLGCQVSKHQPTPRRAGSTACGVVSDPQR